ncbi:hypothetical protein MF672_031925 [Actinomadura sp. ATCC 31491]|uniref:Uncharacterized protein n=1 Tax=Actinomadura luzonensis TaxID=2805427 RepID=A0ABT0G2M4_9ACTN|nr:hypothetical protein [Actinomadura luzonensis]MCK2218368.1 hypothetical protein [Actinomadura luzonensis]
MLDDHVPDSTRTTGRLLRHLLLDRKDYRALWQRHQHRRPAADVMNKHAIAMVLSDHLVDSGIFSESETRLNRKLKDRVGRALDGKILSAETLSWFIDAFCMTPHDEHMLREAHSAGTISANVPLVNTLRLPQKLPMPQRHRTIMLFERRVIDATGRAVTHHSTHTIVACEDGVDSYPCFPYSRASDIVVIHGGHLVEAPDTTADPSVATIALSVSLSEGESTSFEYQRNFHPSADVDTEYRRLVNARTQNIDFVVQFHSLHLPRRVWWAVWDDYQGGQVVEQMPVALDLQHRAHRFLPYMENAVAGFRWTW